MSDDGAWALVVIALLGNPFSPSYARARDAGAPPPALRFSALNVALYGPRGSLWALDERVAQRPASDHELVLGNSAMRWDADRLVVDFSETTAPWRKPFRGRVVLIPEILGRVADTGAVGGDAALSLDAAGRHLWWPVAPAARVHVELDVPRVRFSGHGYHDANAGDVPLEDDFVGWSWSRARGRGGRPLLAYDVVPRRGSPRAVAFAVERDGTAAAIGDVPSAPLPTTRWLVRRQARADAGHRPQVVRSLEDTPFYARALVRTRIAGDDVIAVHEALSLDRLRTRWVRFLLGYRMGEARR